MAWIGILLLSLVWVFLLPVYEPISGGWAVFAALGTALVAAGARRIELPAVSRTHLGLIPALGLYASVVSWPLNLGAWVLAAAIVAGAVFHKRPVVNRLASGVGLAGLVLLAQGMLWPAYEHVASRLHQIPVLNPAVAAVMNLVGVAASSDRGAVYLRTGEGLGQVWVTWESLGLFVVLNALVGGVILLAACRDFQFNAAKLATTTFAYTVARYVVLLAVYASADTPDIFWRRPWVVLSFAPLALVLAKFIDLQPSERAESSPAFGWKTAAACGLAGVAVFALCFGLLFQDPGVKKQGRILFDEGHSDWEWMDQKLDTEWYGQQSTYNYYSLGEYLKHFYSADIKREKLTPEFLKNYDVVVLKTPTQPYAPEEVAAVKDFVARGGGLFLIGDHTNVFGMNTCLNGVAREFGYRFKYDSTYDLSSGHLSLYEPNRTGRHPVLNSLPYYMFATSCSLQAPLLSETVIAGYGLKGLDADYSQRSFFPKEAHSGSAMEFGTMLQMAGSKHGKGRVLLYTDSTCFSNFYMFIPGKPELFLGSLEWLNRSNARGWVNVVSFAFGLLALGGFAFGVRRSAGGRVAAWTFAALLIGGSAGLWTASAVNRRSYPAPQPHTPYQRLVFDQSHSDFTLPDKQLDPNSTNDMHTFFVWTQRIGLFPQVGTDLSKSLGQSDALVLVNPAKAFTDDELDRLTKYVEGGGKVLLLDDPRRIKESTAHQVLSRFGAGIEYYELPKGVLADADGAEIWTGEHFGEVRGGEPLLYLRKPQPQPTAPSVPNFAQASTKGTAVMSVIRRGKGMVVVGGCSPVFTTPVMGTTSVVPNEKLRKLHDLEFHLFRDVLGLKTEH